MNFIADPATQAQEFIFLTIWLIILPYFSVKKNIIVHTSL